MSLRASGMDVPDTPQITHRAEPAGRPQHRRSLKTFEETAELRYAKTSRAKYTNALTEFQAWARGREKTHLVQLGRGAGIHIKRGDWPKLVDQEIEGYEPAELEKLLAATTVEEYVLFHTFRLSGFAIARSAFLPGRTSTPGAAR